MAMFDCILLMAGKGARTSLNYNKIKYIINNIPLYQYSLNQFLDIKECNKIILVVSEEEYNEFKLLENDRIKVVIGGNTRFNSVLNGARYASEDIVMIHDAARPNIKKQSILEVYKKSLTHPSVCLGAKVKNCIRNSSDKTYTLDRKNLWEIQTPQAVNRKLLIQGLENSQDLNYYDDCEVLEKNFDIPCYIVEGDYNNIKVTTDEDLEYIEFLFKRDNCSYKIGHSKDTHRLEKNRKLVLGGVEIPFELGLVGHSDADVVYHCVVESIIGALGLGDIGKLFPDTDMKYKDISSSFFMNEIYQIMIDSNYKVSNIDITIYIEKPLLKEYKPLMEQNIASLLHMNIDDVNVKATRGEGLGFVGRMEGICAEAVCLLKKINNL